MSRFTRPGYNFRLEELMFDSQDSGLGPLHRRQLDYPALDLNNPTTYVRYRAIYPFVSSTICLKSANFSTLIFASAWCSYR